MLSSILISISLLKYSRKPMFVILLSYNSWLIIRGVFVFESLLYWSSRCPRSRYNKTIIAISRNNPGYPCKQEDKDWSWIIGRKLIEWLCDVGLTPTQQVLFIVLAHWNHSLWIIMIPTSMRCFSLMLEPLIYCTGDQHVKSYTTDEVEQH